MRWLVLALLFAAGCLPPPPVYRVQRSARVPLPIAPFRTGEPLAGPLEVGVGTTVAETRDPRLVDSSAAIEVPQREARGELRIRIGRAEIAPFYEQGLGRSRRLDASQAPVEDGAPAGYGLATRYSIRASDSVSVGLGFEATAWQIRYVEHRRCVENCEINNAPVSQVEHGHESVSSIGFGLAPTWRRGALAMFGGVFWRTHPTILRKDTELYVDDERDRDSEVDDGPVNWLVHAGIEYRVPYASVMLNVSKNVTRDPAWYGTQVGLAFALRLPERQVRPKVRYVYR